MKGGGGFDGKLQQKGAERRQNLAGTLPGHRGHPKEMGRGAGRAWGRSRTGAGAVGFAPEKAKFWHWLFLETGQQQ